MIGAALRLTDSSEPIAGATVQVLSGGAVCGQAVTDANGAFEIASSGSCDAAGGELTFRVNGAAPVKSTKLPHGNTTMVVLFVQ